MLVLAFVVATQLDSAPPQTAAVVEPFADYPPVETVTIPVPAPDNAVTQPEAAVRTGPAKGMFFNDYVVDPQLDAIARSSVAARPSRPSRRPSTSVRSCPAMRSSTPPG